MSAQRTLRRGLLVDRGDCELIVKRLCERRDRLGYMPRGDVSEAAALCGVDRATMWRWLRRGTSRPRRRGGYCLTELDKVAFFVACGDMKLAFAMIAEEPGAPPSYDTYRRALLREFDPGTRAAAKHGYRARRQKRVALAIPRVGRNERWEADHKQLSVKVLTADSDEPVSPWLTWVTDTFSHYVVGWAVSTKRPNRGHVLAALREGVELAPERGPVHGIPVVVVWDNGLEFTARAVTEGAAMLGAYAAPTAAFTPEQKPFIERLNLTVDVEFLARLPFYTNGPRGKDGKLYGPKSGPLPLEYFVALLGLWIDNYNHDRVHSDHDSTPLEAWLADGTPVRAADPADLKRLTLERETRKVRHDHGVHIKNGAYAAPEMQGRVGDTVEVGWIPFDHRHVEIFIDGEWLCTAFRVGDATREEVEAMKTAEKELNRESTRLVKKRNRINEHRFAPITAGSPQPELLVQPPKRTPVAALPATTADLLGIAGEIGDVEQPSDGTGGNDV